MSVWSGFTGTTEATGFRLQSSPRDRFITSRRIGDPAALQDSPARPWIATARSR